MTIAFGNLTNSFTNFASLPLRYGSNIPADVLSAARSDLFSNVKDGVLILVYIGIGSFVATYIYMGFWVYTGEVATRRIREKYLKAVLRQNVSLLSFSLLFDRQLTPSLPLSGWMVRQDWCGRVDD
jgi:ATP-binding cassette subfamily B (MDR/TAP) protein 1